MGGDLPELQGMVFMNSCDAMRRLPDAWRAVRSEDKTILIDLPAISNGPAVHFFAGELKRLRRTLEDWSGNLLPDDLIRENIEMYNQLSGLLAGFASEAVVFVGGLNALHKAYAYAATAPLPDALHYVKETLSQELPVKSDGSHPVVYLCGNILPDQEIFDLLEAAGARVLDEDLCTGSRLFQPIRLEDSGDLNTDLARAILSRRPCARTFDSTRPGQLAQDLIARARACAARGVIIHTAKFCDPYLARLPSVRTLAHKEGLPLLVLEGDCSTRSIGQQRTRIEAFIEMLR